MKILLIIIGILFSSLVNAQFNSRTYYKHNEIDGWIKYQESNWYTIDQKGDTTFCQQITEETQQDNPNDKPKYEINGAGNIIKPQPPKAVDKVQYVTAGFIINPTVTTTVEESTVSDSALIFPMRLTDTAYVTKNHYWYSKGKNTTKYKYRDRYKVTKSKKQKPKKEVYTTVNFIKYKKNLYLVAGINGQILMIDESTEKRAKDKFKKLTGKKVLSITQFFQSDIIK